MYFAPEQTRAGSAIGTNVDLWAIGVMLFHCTTGVLPFAHLGDTLEVIVHEIRTQEPRRLVETYKSVCKDASPPWQLDYLQSVIDKALVKDASKRVQTAEKLLALLASVPVHPPPTHSDAGHMPAPAASPRDGKERAGTKPGAGAQAEEDAASSDGIVAQKNRMDCHHPQRDAVPAHQTCTSASSYRPIGCGSGQASGS